MGIKGYDLHLHSVFGTKVSLKDTWVWENWLNGHVHDLLSRNCGHMRCYWTSPILVEEPPRLQRTNLVKSPPLYFMYSRYSKNINNMLPEYAFKLPVNRIYCMYVALLEPEIEL